MTNERERCACGRPLHYTDPYVRAIVEELIADLGPDITVRELETGRAWRIPRHYIALHGIKRGELRDLATRFGFTEVSDGWT